MTRSSRPPGRRIPNSDRSSPTTVSSTSSWRLATVTRWSAITRDGYSSATQNPTRCAAQQTSFRGTVTSHRRRGAREYRKASIRQPTSPNKPSNFSRIIRGQTRLGHFFSSALFRIRIIPSRHREDIGICTIPTQSPCRHRSMPSGRFRRISRNSTRSAPGTRAIERASERSL